MIIPTQSFPNRSHSVQCWAIIKIIKPGFISVGDEWLNASFQLHQGQDSRAFYQYMFVTCKWIQWMGNIITRWRCHWCSLWAPVTACTAISRVRVRVQIMQRADPASIAQVTKSVIPADHCCDYPHSKALLREWGMQNLALNWLYISTTPKAVKDPALGVLFHWHWFHRSKSSS